MIPPPRPARRLFRENNSLHELLAYTTEFPEVGADQYADEGYSSPYAVMAAHYGDGSPTYSSPPGRGEPRGAYSFGQGHSVDEVSAVDSYYSSLLSQSFAMTPYTSELCLEDVAVFGAATAADQALVAERGGEAGLEGEEGAGSSSTSPCALLMAGVAESLEAARSGACGDQGTAGAAAWRAGGNGSCLHARRAGVGGDDVHVAEPATKAAAAAPHGYSRPERRDTQEPTDILEVPQCFYVSAQPVKQVGGRGLSGV